MVAGYTMTPKESRTRSGRIMASTREGGTAPVEATKRLLRHASHAEVQPNLLLLNRGFYSVATIRYLQAAKYPFIMPVIM